MTKKHEMIQRITLMEFYFDTLRSALTVVPHALRGDGPVAEMLRTLTDYYEGGQWLADFASDEQGLLPPQLKRGVLSEDGLYDLLCEIKQS